MNISISRISDKFYEQPFFLLLGYVSYLLFHLFVSCALEYIGADIVLFAH